MVIEITKAKAEDLPLIIDLWHGSFSTPWSAEDIKNEMLIPDNVFLVARADGQFAGYALMKIVYDSGELCNIAVVHSMRGEGIGKELTMAVIGEAIARGLICVMLEVRVSNAAAISLYSSCGFEKVGIRRDYYRAPREDALLFTYNTKKD